MLCCNISGISKKPTDPLKMSAPLWNHVQVKLEQHKSKGVCLHLKARTHAHAEREREREREREIFFFVFVCTSFIPCGKLGSPYLEKTTAVVGVALPFPNSRCGIFVCSNKGMAAVFS